MPKGKNFRITSSKDKLKFEQMEQKSRIREDAKI